MKEYSKQINNTDLYFQQNKWANPADSVIEEEEFNNEDLVSPVVSNAQKKRSDLSEQPERQSMLQTINPTRSEPMTDLSKKEVPLFFNPTIN